MSRRALPQSRLKARKRARLLILAGTFTGILLLGAGGIVAVLHASFLRIHSIAVIGTQTVAAAALHEYVQNEIAGSRLGIIPKDNIFFYPKDALREGLLAAYPTLQSVTLQRDTFSSISVTAIEREPQALWCGDALNRKSPCLFLDAQGLAYAPAPEFSAPVYTVYYGPLQRDPASLPVQYLSTEQFHTLLPLVAALVRKAQSSDLLNVEVDSVGDVRLYLSDTEIRFALGDDAGKTLERFSVILTSAPFFDHALSDFEYVDLRFGDKVYYKLK